MSETAKTGHPKGLWVLFGTEMWERFNFYGMRALLTLFMVHSLKYQESDSSIFYGGFLALCYLTPMLGGYISDKYLGNRSCIMIGGLLMGMGQLFLFFSASIFSGSLETAKTLMWCGLFVIIFGNGFFKPNISSMVGSLYPKQEKTKLDTAFTIFYMGINLGAFLGQLICPLVGDVKEEGVQNPFVFKWGFLAAAIAMFLGTIVFYTLKNKYVITPEGKPIGGLPKNNDASDFEEGESQNAVFSGKAIGIALAVFAGLFFVFRYMLVGEFGFTSTGMSTLVKGIIYPFIYSAGVSLAVLIVSDSSITKVELSRIFVIYIVSFFIIFFWAAFEQAGSSLTFIASNQTDRNFFGWDMPASMVQIFNGLFVVIMAVPFSILWDKLRAVGKEPVSPFKQAIGLFLIAISYFIIAHNVKDLGNSGLLSVKWLILLYLIQTCGELCLSPIGLSLVGKLAPKRFASLLYGVFFIANAAGYALAGSLGAIMPATGDKFAQAQELGINLQDVLDKKKPVSGKDLFLLGQANLGEIKDAKLEKDFKTLFDKNTKTIEIYKAREKKNFEIDLANKKSNEILSSNNKFISTLKTTKFEESSKLIESHNKEIKKIEKKYSNIKQKDIVIDQSLLKFPSDDILKQIVVKKSIVCENPNFAGFEIHNLFEFFMVFVVLCGIAGLILALISPVLKKMMQGVK